VGLAHAVAEHRPDAITIPLNAKGKPSFKLVHLVEANGLALDHAHDAQADTRATLALAKHLRDRAPEIWDALYACRSKNLVSEVLAKGDLVLFTDRMFRKSTILAGLICVAPDNPATHAMFDLSYDPTAFLELDIERAQHLLRSNPRPIRILKASNLPIVQPYRDGREADVDIVTARERMAKIKAHPNFTSAIAQVLAGQYEDQEPSQRIEEQIYGEFPSRNDERLMEKFHQAPWRDRYAMAQGFEDARYREFAERIVYAEYPDGLPATRRAELDEWRRERFIAEGDVPWMTIAKAREELNELKNTATEQHADLIAEVADYLDLMSQSFCL
jgi:exodeoxyribonuclease-1